MAFLSSTQRHTLAMICDTLAPALTPENGDDPALFALSAADIGLADLLETGLEKATDETTQAQLRQFFDLLENPAINGVMAGSWGRFSSLPLETRTTVLRAWALSRLPLARRAFNGVKRMALFLFYAAPVEQYGGQNPAWKWIGYQTPPLTHDNENNENGAASRPIKPLEIAAPTTLNTDVLIIGSGAGGGVVAGELTAAGYEVIVAEKGEYFADHEFPRHELGANERMYEKHGALTTADAAITVLAGSTLGGGTTINWAGSLRPPDYVLQEWEREYGFEGITGQDFQDSLDAVSRRMDIDTDESNLNANNAAFERGCKALNRGVTVIPRNVKGCEECGFCNFGCRFGAKQGTLKTYLQDAHDRGARILVRAHAERITHQNGAVTGAQLTVTDSSGTPFPVTVRARVVIVAAGSVHSPALLLRSGLTNPNIGDGLRLHPTTVTSGLFAEPVRPWQGPPMTRIMTDFANLDGRGYGVRLMTAPAHPGIYGFATAWLSGRQHRQDMQHTAHKGNVIVITRDFHGGRVCVNKHGQPILDYKMHPYDAKHMMRGITEALRIHRAAGALELVAPHNQRPQYRVGKDGDFDVYLRSVENLGLRSNGFALFSAHQMASCRISGSAKQGVLDPTGQTYEVKNLFVVDGSVLPTCSGVNPMLTILGVSHLLAQRIKTRIASA